MFALLVVHAVSFAQDSEAPPPPPPPVVRQVPITPMPRTPAVYGSPEWWARRDHRARGTYTGGVITGLVGFTFDTVGWYVGNEGLRAFGVMGEMVGSPLMAGGSLRSARALREQGAHVGRGWGAASWTMWGSAFIFEGAAQSALEDAAGSTSTTTFGGDATEPQPTRESQLLGYLGLGCRLGSYLTAGFQGATNARARRELGWARLDDDERGGARFAIAPAFDGRRVGLVLAADGL